MFLLSEGQTRKHGDVSKVSVVSQIFVSWTKIGYFIKPWEFSWHKRKKIEVKFALWGFSTLWPFGLFYSYPQQLPPFISKGATQHTDARDLYQRRRELLAMNFCSKSVIHENSLGSFTCRKAGTWDIVFYFPSEIRHTEDFSDARKIQKLRPGLNPRTRVPVASMLTTRTPKPST